MYALFQITIMMISKTDKTFKAYRETYNRINIDLCEFHIIIIYLPKTI